MGRAAGGLVPLWHEPAGWCSLDLITSWRNLAGSYLPLPWGPLPWGPLPLGPASASSGAQSRGPSYLFPATPVSEKRRTALLRLGRLGLSPGPPVHLCGSPGGGGSLLLHWGAGWWPGEGAREEKSWCSWGRPAVPMAGGRAGSLLAGGLHTLSPALWVRVPVALTGPGPASPGRVLRLCHPGHQPVPRCRRGAWKRQVSGA